jgi:hypothetical protein
VLSFGYPSHMWISGGGRIRSRVPEAWKHHLATIGRTKPHRAPGSQSQRRIKNDGRGPDTAKALLRKRPSKHLPNAAPKRSLTQAIRKRLAAGRKEQARAAASVSSPKKDAPASSPQKKDAPASSPKKSSQARESAKKILHSASKLFSSPTKPPRHRRKPYPQKPSKPSLGKPPKLHGQIASAEGDASMPESEEPMNPSPATHNASMPKSEEPINPPVTRNSQVAQPVHNSESQALVAVEAEAALRQLHFPGVCHSYIVVRSLNQSPYDIGYLWLRNSCWADTILQVLGVVACHDTGMFFVYFNVADSTLSPVFQAIARAVAYHVRFAGDDVAAKHKQMSVLKGKFRRAVAEKQKGIKHKTASIMKGYYGLLVGDNDKYWSRY